MSSICVSSDRLRNFFWILEIIIQLFEALVLFRHLAIMHWLMQWFYKRTYCFSFPNTSKKEIEETNVPFKRHLFPTEIFGFMILVNKMQLSINIFVSTFFVTNRIQSDVYAFRFEFEKFYNWYYMMRVHMNSRTIIDFKSI